eukprot:gb/GEZN01008207.1/.p1 GENE.gb/GEZN01008207.1/~~gb/GEZN01008207.1/.p1  ORF type:complete len:449 (+),score=96.76 gb/GEZN01008207.1/:141-1349(+)
MYRSTSRTGSRRGSGSGISFGHNHVRGSSGGSSGGGLTNWVSPGSGRFARERDKPSLPSPPASPRMLDSPGSTMGSLSSVAILDIPEGEGSQAHDKLRLRTPVILMVDTLLDLGISHHLIGLIVDYSRDIEGHFVCKFGKAGAADGKLSYPHMMAIEDNEIFVVDHENHRVQVFRRGNGRFLRKFGTKGVAPGEFLFPTGIAIYKDEVFVSEFLYPRIQVFRRSDGKYIRQLGEKNDQLAHPGGICIHDEELYIADAGDHHCVQVFALDGQFLRKFGEGKLGKPCAVTAMGDKIFVADTAENARHVMVFNKQGQYLDRIGKIYRASNVLAVLDLLFVTDCGANRVLVFDHITKSMVRRWPERFTNNQPTRRSGKFTQPMGMASVGDELYVADSWNHQVQLFI